MMRAQLLFCLVAAAAATISKQQPLEPLTKFRAVSFARAGDRKACVALFVSSKVKRTGKQQMVSNKLGIDVAWQMCFSGRLCAAAYVHNSQAYTVRG